MNTSLAQRFAALPEAKRKKILASLSPKERAALEYTWEWWARPNQIEPEGDWRVWLLLSGRGSGKALAIDTPIPTPSGWKTMGELQVGDEVFDERGRPCRVTFATDVMHGRPCFDVRLMTGETIVADADHLWRLASGNVVRTNEMRATLVRSARPVRLDFTDVAITSIEPSASVPVRCIQVDSQRHLFLVGRSCVPTHNTRTGAEWVRRLVEAGRASRIALIAPTAADARDVVTEGESGLLNVCPPWHRPQYEPSRRRLTWPNGAIATLYSAEEPDRLRGPQHDAAWCDEVAAWRYPEAWDQLMFGLRLGDDPRVVATTTPRPTPLIKALVASATTHVTRGSTYENRAHLADGFLREIERRYANTRIGRQEIHGEILDDCPGAIFHAGDIEKARVREAPPLVRVVVGVDPALSTNENSDLTGLVVVGLGTDGHAYVLADVSGKYTPAEWARRVIAAYHAHRADRVVVEKNAGGDLVVSNLRTIDPRVPILTVHASRGKAIRAEPVAALYEQGRVHHVGVFAALEDEMVSWDPTTSAKSPDRLDALVWGCWALLLSEQPVLRNFDNLPPG